MTDFFGGIGALRNAIHLARHIPLVIPDYSTVCRCRKKLQRTLSARARNEPLHLVIDLAGVKVCDEGEWKVRQLGYSKRLT